MTIGLPFSQANRHTRFQLTFIDTHQSRTENFCQQRDGIKGKTMTAYQNGFTLSNTLKLEPIHFKTKLMKLGKQTVHEQNLQNQRGPPGQRKYKSA